MLIEDFMPGYGLTAVSLAEALRVSRRTVYELLRGRPAVDLWKANLEVRKDLENTAAGSTAEPMTWNVGEKDLGRHNVAKRINSRDLCDPSSLPMLC